MNLLAIREEKKQILGEDLFMIHEQMYTYEDPEDTLWIKTVRAGQGSYSHESSDLKMSYDIFKDVGNPIPFKDLPERVKNIVRKSADDVGKYRGKIHVTRREIFGVWPFYGGDVHRYIS